MVKLSPERVDEIATEFREALAPRTPAMSIADQQPLVEYEEFLAIAQRNSRIERVVYLLLESAVRGPGDDLAYAAALMELQQLTGFVCCDCGVTAHSNVGCELCGCECAWAEHRDRGSDPQAGKKLRDLGLDQGESWPSPQWTADETARRSRQPPATQIAGACLRCNHPNNFHGPSIGAHPTPTWCTGLGPDGGQCTCTDFVRSWDEPNLSNPYRDEPYASLPMWFAQLNAVERGWLREAMRAGMPIPNSLVSFREIHLNATGGPGGLR